MSDLDEDPVWLYRGVPFESPERLDVKADGEIRPPRPDRRGREWQYAHSIGDNTETAYTSWSAVRSIAVAAAEDMSEKEDLSGRIVIFRVRFSSIDSKFLSLGDRDDEAEYLIEGAIEDVQFSIDEDEEE